MRIMILIALVLSCIPMFLALLLPNWYLGDKQNAVDDVDLLDGALDRGDGEIRLDREEEEESFEATPLG